MKILLAVCMTTLLLGCGAALNSALTPSVSSKIDPFDGAVIIEQPPISAASKMGEVSHTMGFEWAESHPDTVYLTIGSPGITSVQSVAFNVDGEIIDTAKAVSQFTDMKRDDYGGRSTRRLSISLSDFKKIASGKLVKMKVSAIDTYTVSSFGTSTQATVGPKFEPFLQKVAEAKVGSK